MSGVYVDEDGARWPITGLTCAVCALPMHPMNARFGMHPNCELEGKAT